MSRRFYPTSACEIAIRSRGVDSHDCITASIWGEMYRMTTAALPVATARLRDESGPLLEAQAATFYTPIISSIESETALTFEYAL